MGYYSSLIINVDCKSCGAWVLDEIQFKFGYKFLHHYGLRSPLRWHKDEGGNYGEPGNERVLVYGWLVNVCPECQGALQDNDEYGILIENDVIQSAHPLTDDDTLEEGENRILP